MKKEKRIPQSLGAMASMLENSKLITNKVLKRAEQLAIERSKKDGYEPCLLRRDIEQAIKEARRK